MLSRWLLSLLLLSVLVWWLGPDRVIGQVQTLNPEWVMVALLIGAGQVLLSAGRWWLTARFLNLDLSYRHAVEEYYLASLINQLLPGGVVGDAYRAKRHADWAGQTGPAWFAVIIERFSGQLMLLLMTGAVMLSAPQWHDVAGDVITQVHDLDVTWGPIGLGLFIVFIMTFMLMRWRHRLRDWGGAFVLALHRAFWPAHRLTVQVLSSALIVLSYIAVMLLAAWAVGVKINSLQLAIMAPPLLLAMVLPISVSGWGVREWMAWVVWSAMGLDPAQGVAVSMAYGVLIFLTALPGLVMWRHRRRDTP